MAVADYLSVTRASVKRGLVSGVWTSFPIDTPAFTDDGLLIEAARTNSIRNSSMQGAAVGVIGSGGALPTNWGIAGGTGLTVEVVEIAVRKGLDAIAIRLSGTTGSTFALISFETASAIAASEGQVRTHATFYELGGGSLSNISAVRHELSQAGGAGSTQTVFTPDTTLSRRIATRTMPASTTFAIPRVVLAYSSGVEIDVTLWIAAPQEELGAKASSPIRTTGTAATRAADDITLSDLAFFKDGQPGTIFAEFVVGDPSENLTAVYFNDGTTNNRIQVGIWGATGQGWGFVVDGALGQASLLAGPALAAGDTCRIALAFAENNMRAAVNGTLSILDTSAAVPTGIDRCRIGGSSTTLSVLNASLRNIGYRSRRLSDAELVAWSGASLAAGVALGILTMGDLALKLGDSYLMMSGV
ncbi:phage head spike fiber domain-containing protein [Microbaculum marinum]|uniref:Minor tail protein n=1 Tax=Microbaculum marinum TaxID=1764581 RepID=A0AAW9RCC2_9HYPH